MLSTHARVVRVRNWLALGAVLTVAFVVGVVPANGQEAAGAQAAPPAAEAKKVELKGRLPSYYGEVVTGEQKEKIYAIQTRHNATIKKLQEQLEATVATRDKEVEEVLTAEQRERVMKMVNDAKQKRLASTTSKKKPTEGAAPAVPPTPAPAPTK